MINREPSLKEMAKLWNLVADRLEEYSVSCPEACVEDRIYEDAPNLVEDLSEIVGYTEDEF